MFPSPTNPSSNRSVMASSYLSGYGYYPSQEYAQVYGDNQWHHYPPPPPPPPPSHLGQLYSDWGSSPLSEEHAEYFAHPNRSSPFEKKEESSGGPHSHHHPLHHPSPDSGLAGDESSPKGKPFEWMTKRPSRTSSTSVSAKEGRTRTKDKYRVVYSDHQRLELEKEFHYSRYITIRRKAELAQGLGLTERQVKIWFQNRRAKERKQMKKREEVVSKDKIENALPPPPPHMTFAPTSAAAAAAVMLHHHHHHHPAVINSSGLLSPP